MRHIVLIWITLLLFACKPHYYYQVYRAEALGGISDEKKMIFENAQCKVSYDFWANGGSSGFTFYNKTNQDIVLHLDQSFFVVNKKARPYFMNKTISISKSASKNNARYFPSFFYYGYFKIESKTERGIETSFTQLPELSVPPGAEIEVEGLNITKERLILCDLEKYPNFFSMKTLDYNKENSPLVFYNLISYSSAKEMYRFENQFYVNQITNLPSSEMFHMVSVGKCGKVLSTPIKEFKNKQASKFYFQYK